MRPSFDAVFAAEFGPLYRYLHRRVGADGAEDLAAATFATAYANWDRFDPVRPVRPWLYGIAANLVRHHWRDERRMLRAYARTGVDPVLARTMKWSIVWTFGYGGASWLPRLLSFARRTVSFCCCTPGRS